MSATHHIVATDGDRLTSWPDGDTVFVTASGLTYQLDKASDPDEWILIAPGPDKNTGAAGGGTIAGHEAAYDHPDLVAKKHVAATVADTASIDLAIAGQQISGVVLPAGVDHNSLANYAASRHFLQTEIDHLSTGLATGLVKVTTATGAISIVTDNSANWNTAFGWGDHALAGYLTSISGLAHDLLGGLADDDHTQYVKVTGRDGETPNIVFGNLKFTTITAPGAPTIGSIGAGGSVDTGNHYYKITYVTASGETELGTVSAVATTTAGNNTVNLTGIPVSTETGVTSRRVYRTKVASATLYYLVATVGDNVTTTYTDTAADATLTNTVQAIGRDNTTAGRLYLGSSYAGLFGTVNLALGVGALALLTTGSSNVCLGGLSGGKITSGYQNICLGYASGFKLTTGGFNTALGVNALHECATAFGNFALGINALYNATGNSNVGIGGNALFNLTSGTPNTAIGANCGYFLQTGNNNIFIGYEAGRGGAGVAYTGADNNVFIGHQAGYSVITNQDSNVFIGYQAGYSATGNSNVFIGYQAGYNETGSNKLYIANSNTATPLIYGDFSTPAVAINGYFTLPKTSGYGIRVDTALPTWGWRDLLGRIIPQNAGTGPAWAAYRTSGAASVSAYKWAAGAVKEVWVEFHVPHDYVPGTDVYLHCHWSQITVDTGGPAGVPGSVVWNFDFSYADGHGTAGGAADPFIAPLALSVTQQGSTTQYGHMIAEVAISNNGGDATHIDRNTLTPDGVFLVRLWRDNTLAADTLDQDAWTHYVDMHYQSTNIGTKQKTGPTFWT